MTKLKRILLTGAAGSLGSILRNALPARCHQLRLNDRLALKSRSSQEEIAVCDLADREAVMNLTRETDVVIHMGGLVGGQLPFDEVLRSNCLGLHNLYEGCRLNGVKRVIWGSSNHAVGFYPRTVRLDASVTPRPDSFYGVSKVFGEAMAQYYWDKFGLESVSLRIGSCFPKPTDTRMLSTWLSYQDLIHLVECCIDAPRVEHTIVYGVSNNDSLLWDNRMAAHLGYRPRDNAQAFREEVDALVPPCEPDDLAIAVHGGGFAKLGH